MIAQILARGRRGRPAVSQSTSPSSESRVLDVGARWVGVLLAILLLPALATVLVVGGLGALAVGLAATVSRLLGVGNGRPRPE